MKSCLIVYLLALSGCGFPRPADVVGDGETIDALLDDSQSIDPSSSPVSCLGLAATCGANRNDNCCNSLEVPGGSYYRSFDAAGSPTSGNMNYPATVSSFRLDKYEVTVGRFRAFIEAGMGVQANPPGTNAGAHEMIPGSGWDPNWNSNLPISTAELVAQLKCFSQYLNTWTDLPGSNEDRPINCITWFEAMAFCAWDGSYLPTEAEWNYAAAGGDLQRAYPWSGRAAPLAIDHSHASYEPQCLGDGVDGCAVTDLIVVGTKPLGNGRWGHSDLAGNVYEWTLDWGGQYTVPCIDCANLTPSLSRISRGGSYSDGDGFLRTLYRRNATPPGTALVIDGFRCARNL
jgi:formylglycine-generating enzyme